MRRTLAVLATTTTLLTGSFGAIEVVAAQGASAATATCDGMASVTSLPAVTYADQLVRAWGRGDRAAAACYAAPSVLATLFGQADPGGIHWRRTGVEGTAGTIYVTYHDDARGGTLAIGVQDLGLRGPGGWHAAYTATFRNEPPAPGPVGWADGLIRAWGRGDRALASYYATPGVVSGLFSYADPGGGLWWRVGSSGAAGTTFVTYAYGSTSRRVTVGVGNEALWQGDAHVAYTMKVG